MTLIYTLGRTSIYEVYFDYAASPAKAAGGSVWQTLDDVRAYLAKHPLPFFSIYGVQAEWGKDTRPDSAGGDYHELLVARPLKRL